MGKHTWVKKADTLYMDRLQGLGFSSIKLYAREEESKYSDCILYLCGHIDGADDKAKRGYLIKKEQFIELVIALVSSNANIIKEKALKLSDFDIKALASFLEKLTVDDLVGSDSKSEAETLSLWVKQFRNLIEQKENDNINIYCKLY